MTLLTGDHKMRPDHTHPTFSPDGKRILFQSGLLSNGKSLNLMTVVIPEVSAEPALSRNDAVGNVGRGRRTPPFLKNMAACQTVAPGGARYGD